MKTFKILSFFALFLVISSTNSAPTGETKSLYDTISSDSRFVSLLSQKFVQECKTSQPACIALIDVTLRLNEAHLDFAKVQNQHDDDFCSTKLLKVLPDTPTSDYTVTIEKSFNLTWFKDILKQNDGKMCSKQCTYDSYEDYSRRVKPVCVFIYEQYKMLDVTKTVNKTQKNESISIESVEAPKEAGTQVDVVEAKKTVPTQDVTVNKTETSVEQEQVKTSTVATKKVDDLSAVSTAPEVTANKSEAQLKADTKTANINLDDQQSVLGENSIFDQTPGPDNDDNGNLENIDGGVNGDDDEDDMYALDGPIRDNNLNGNKFQQEQLSDIEPHDSDSPQRVPSAPFEEDPDSNFFTYLCIVMFLTIILYILYHNRQKILALLLEGRQGRSSRRPRSRNGSKAAYSKLDCNLEEAITSKKSLSGKSMDVIY